METYFHALDDKIVDYLQRTTYKFKADDILNTSWFSIFISN